MGRKITKAPSYRKSKRGDHFDIDIKLGTITPLFGGSAIVRKVDKGWPVRASNIRGQLRFWWRTLYGWLYTDSKSLFKAEKSLWGDTDYQGKVALRIIPIKKGEPVKATAFGPKKPVTEGPLESYFLFPFRKTVDQIEEEGLVNLEFRLIVTTQNLTDDDREQIEGAIKAWIMFGGVGARTRRGLGALTVVSEPNRWLPPSPAEISIWLKLPGGRAPIDPEIPSLKGAHIALGPDHREYAGARDDNVLVLLAWREAGRFWAQFRKGHFISGERYEPTKGSRWRDHETLLKLAPDAKEVPLAKPYFGLPIVYQKFKEKRVFSGTIEAAAEHGVRMASPVVLKPIAFANGEIRPAVLVLNAPAPKHVYISRRGTKKKYRLIIPNNDRVLTSVGVETPLDAVLKTAQKLGWREVDL